MRENSLSLLATAILGIVLCASLSKEVFAGELQTTVSKWEGELEARIGVMLRDVSSDWEVSYRADERFPMSSTFKVLLCGAVLARANAGQESLSELVTYSKKKLVSWSPVTEKRVEHGMTVSNLCDATITMSDNTAANLLLSRIDGPDGLTGFLRRIGDRTTRLDRWETELNEGAPKDLRDTTTPRAITRSLNKLLFGNVLQPASAAQLKQWMIDDQVADKLIRPHIQEDWTIGDKTGAGGYGSRSIIAFLKTPEEHTYLVAVYLTESEANFDLRNHVISDIGRAIVSEITQRK